MTFLQRITSAAVALLFSVVLLMEVAVQPEYHFDDYPYFSHKSVLLLLSAVAVVAVTIGVMKLGEKLSWNVWVPFAFFLFLSAVFLGLVPMIPVSDQGIVFSIASNNLADPNNYMNVNVNVIPTILYVYGVVSVLGRSLWTVKIANVICGMLSLVLTSKIYGVIVGDETIKDNGVKGFFSLSERKMLWWGAIFLPAFFYNNHIYNDVPAVTLSLIMIYLVVRDDKSLLLRMLTVIVSCLQLVLRQSGIILVVAVWMYVFFYQKRRWYSVIYIVSVITLYFLIARCYTMLMVGEGASGYPVWSFIKMGINEAEFGFQDNTHSTYVTFMDCVDRYREYGLIKVLVIYAKKVFWIWGEGTYQSGRYGYGYLDNPYEYSTFFTSLISGSSDRVIRVATNLVLRAQYLFYMFLAVIGTLKARKKQEFSLLFFAICGFFLFYLVWEIKSRYLYGLYPVFLMLALYGWEKGIVNRHVRKQ